MVFSFEPEVTEKLSVGSSRPVLLVELYPRPAPRPTPSPWTPWDDSKVTSYPLRFCLSDAPLRNVTISSPSATVIREQTIIPNIVTSVTPLGAEVDAIKRNVSQEDVSIEFADDGTLRNLLSPPGINHVGSPPYTALNPNVTTMLLGQKVIIKIGFADINISKFQALGTFEIAEISPRQGVIEVSAKALTNIASTQRVSRNFAPGSAHEQMHEILYNTLGLSSAGGTYDEASVDAWFTNGASPINDTDKRFWSVARVNSDIDGGFLAMSKAPEGDNPWTLLNQLAFMTGGFICQRENGYITYVPWDGTAAAVRNLTADDIDTFEQVSTYAITTNSIGMKITNTVKKTEWDPMANTSGIPASGAVGPRPTAYFGGLDGDETFSMRMDESAQDFRYPDPAVSIPVDANKRWYTYESNLDWESGMSGALFMEARLVVWGPSDNWRFGTGVNPLGPASYDAATRKVTLLYGKVNIDDPPTTLDQQISPMEGDWVSPVRGPVIRITGSYDHGFSPCYDEAGNSVLFKEGRIVDVDNSGASTVFTLADDHVLEFEDDWGTVGALPGGPLNWQILEPEYPIPCSGADFVYVGGGGTGYQYRGLNPTLGLRQRQYNVPIPPAFTGPGTGGYSEPWQGLQIDFSRYFYIVFPSLTGVSGASLPTTSTYQNALGAPYSRWWNWHMFGGPGFQEFVTGRIQPGGWHLGPSGNPGQRPRPNIRGPGGSRGVQLAMSAPYGTQMTYPGEVDMHNFYGHYPPGVGRRGYDPWDLGVYPDTSSAKWSQLRSAERVRMDGIAGENARYAYLKIASGAWSRGGTSPFSQRAQYEYIKCNLAYPLNTCFRTAVGNVWDAPSGTIGLQGGARHDPGIRKARNVLEGNSLKDGNSMDYTTQGQVNPNTFAFRVSAESALIGYDGYVPETANSWRTRPGFSYPPTVGANANAFGVNRIQPNNTMLDYGVNTTGNWKFAAIIPEGRGQMGTSPTGFQVPPNVTNVIPNPPPSGTAALYSPANALYLSNRATDVTIAKAVSERILTRCAYGMPEIEFSTSLMHLDLQIGDFVSITHPLYLRHGKNGSDTGTIFELIRKEVNIEEDSPRIQWKAAFVRQDGETLGGTEHDPNIDHLIGIQGGKFDPAAILYDNDGKLLLSLGGESVFGGTQWRGSGAPWHDDNEE